MHAIILIILLEAHLCCADLNRRGGFGAVVCEAITAAYEPAAAGAACRVSGGADAVVPAASGHADVAIRHELANREVYDAQAA